MLCYLRHAGYFHRGEKEVQLKVSWEVDLIKISFVCDNFAFHKQSTILIVWAENMFFRGFYKFSSGKKVALIYSIDGWCYFIPFGGSSMSDRV